MVSKSGALVVCAVLSLASCGFSIAVNGYNIGSASYNDGKIEFVKDLKWAWAREHQPVEYLNLVGRDEWSVYLCGSSKSHAVQIDFWKKSISLNDHEFGTITSASAGRINGRNAGSAAFKRGEFQHIAHKEWIWLNHKAVKNLHFMEKGRDEWSVYLEAVDLDLAIQLDYFRKSIRFGGIGHPKTDVFKITGARHSTVNYRYAC